MATLRSCRCLDYLRLSTSLTTSPDLVTKVEHLIRYFFHGIGVVQTDSNASNTLVTHPPSQPSHEGGGPWRVSPRTNPIKLRIASFVYAFLTGSTILHPNISVNTSNFYRMDLAGNYSDPPRHSNCQFHKLAPVLTNAYSYSYWNSRPASFKGANMPTVGTTTKN